MTDVVLLSDTHNVHGFIEVGPCDLLVHAGDFTRHGTLAEAEDFFAWFGAQPARAKVLTPGNHDLVCEREPARFAALAAEHGITWLLDQEAELCGLRVWASPFSPRHGAWAFQDERGPALRARWERIPEGLDLLVTHGPPRGHGDTIVRGAQVGCADLLAVVRARSPRWHVFGHVHEAHGESSEPGLATRFLNVSNFISISVRNPSTTAARPAWRLTV